MPPAPTARSSRTLPSPSMPASAIPEAIVIRAISSSGPIAARASTKTSSEPVLGLDPRNNLNRVTQYETVTGGEPEATLLIQPVAMWTGDDPATTVIDGGGSIAVGTAILGIGRGASGIIASNGTSIVGFTMHGVDRAIGDLAGRAGTKPQAILEALKSPTKKVVEGVDRQGRRFQVFTGRDARVVVNPDSGRIISVNPLSRLGAQP